MIKAQVKRIVRAIYAFRCGYYGQPEASLLQTINAPLAPEARTKRDALLAEQARRELTGEEQATLTDLIDAVEMANAARWQALAALACLRGLSLAEITRDLEIPLLRMEKSIL